MSRCFDAHLLEMDGERDAAHDAYLAAAKLTSNLPQQRQLHARAARLRTAGSDATRGSG